MRTGASFVSVLLWFFLLHSTAAHRGKRNAIPKFSFDPETAKTCTWWLDNDGSWTCQGVEQVFEVSVVDFMRWNPSLTAHCGQLPANQSFCLATNEGWRSSSVGSQDGTSPAPQTTVTVPTTVAVTEFVTETVTVPAVTISMTVLSTSTVSSQTTVTAAATVSVRTTITVPTTVSVTVPTTVPSTVTAPVTVRVTTVQTNTSTSRATIRTTIPTTVPVTDRVTTVLVSTTTSISRTTVTSTVTAQGGPTPLPYQPGMVGNCKGFYFVQWGDTCDGIAARFGISAAQIVAWNPQARSDCTMLLAETYCCIRA